MHYSVGEGKFIQSVVRGVENAIFAEVQALVPVPIGRIRIDHL